MEYLQHVWGKFADSGSTWMHTAVAEILAGECDPVVTSTWLEVLRNLQRQVITARIAKITGGAK